MAINNGYVTLDEIKSYLFSGSKPESFTPEDEANMEFAVEAISRLWDSEFGTNFYGASETRYFTAPWGDLCYVDDLISITTLKTDEDGDATFENTWATTDYWLEPRNARVPTADKDKKPYRQIRVNPNGDYSFPCSPHAVEIVGTWGYTNGIQSTYPTQVPSVVKQGVLMMAARVYKRKDAIFGVAGAPALGVQVIQARIQQDSDIMQLMTGVDRRGFYA